MKRSFIIFSFIAVFALSGFSQTKVMRVNAIKSNNYGVEYVLPKTILAIDVEYTETTYQAGQYARYASRYLGMKDNEVISENQTLYTLDKASVRNECQPNNEEAYLVELKAKTTAPFVYLTEDRIICTINADYVPAPALKETVDFVAPKETFISPQSIFTEEYLKAGSLSKMAEVAAKSIYAIRESRQDILTGEVENMPKDGEAMRIVLNSLDEQERLWTELFTGTRKETKHRKTVYVEPVTEIQNDVLFRFSKYLGILGKDDLGGSPVYINIIDLYTVDIPEPDPKRKAKEPQSIVYNVPGKAVVEIYNGNLQMYRGEHNVTQFGTTQILATSLFEDKNNPVKIYFYPETGAIKQILQ